MESETSREEARKRLLGVEGRLELGPKTNFADEVCKCVDGI
jgi:hypothetical protein